MLEFLSLKFICVAGLALYLSIVVINNITDPATNLGLIVRMMSMEEIKQDPTMGNGLEWRAVRSTFVPKASFYFIVVYQVVTAVLLWRGAYFLLAAIFGSATLPQAIAAANIGLGAFALIWIGFICGGLWFGYWMKMGPGQQTHMTLLILSMLAILIINLTPA